MPRFKIVFCFVLACLLLPVSWAGAKTDPAQVVDKLHSALLEVMKKGPELGYSGRFKRLEPVIRETFDFDVVSRNVVGGRYWDSWDDKQKDNFIKTLAKLSTATYASEFDSFSNEAFRHISDEKVKDDRILVKTEIVDSAGKPVRLDYLVHENADHWQIINVFAGGVSDISVKRGEYTAVLKDQGYDALITMLNEKITQYEKK